MFFINLVFVTRLKLKYGATRCFAATRAHHMKSGKPLFTILKLGVPYNYIRFQWVRYDVERSDNRLTSTIITNP